jgi:hypothetical protein
MTDRVGLALSLFAEIGFVGGASWLPALIVRDATMGACRAGEPSCDVLASYGLMLGFSLAAMVLVSAILLPGIQSGLLSRRRWTRAANVAEQDAFRRKLWTYANGAFAVAFVVALFRVGKQYGG